LFWYFASIIILVTTTAIMDKNYQHHPRYSPTMLIPIKDCPGEPIAPFTFKPWQKRNVPGVMSILLRRKMDQVKSTTGVNIIVICHDCHAQVPTREICNTVPE
jgi:hypothetical protein